MNIDWEKLGFEFRPTRSNVRVTYKDGAWGSPRLENTYEITMSVASNCLHYGQALFEGGKAFHVQDGSIKAFRPWENSARLNSSARRLLMPEVPESLYMQCLDMVIKDNADYVPPYGTGGALYIRPVMFGTTPQIGVASSLEYEFVILVVPVGAYYNGGIKPVNAMISDYDRAAPHGTGQIKCAGNYAASLYPGKLAKKAGCAVALFLDPQTHTYIDEFGTSNFFAITRDKHYVTPDSPSILPSITNKSLMQLAADLGYSVERRRIRRQELANFVEVAACGTAVVITPVGKIFADDGVYDYHCESIGPNLKRLYDEMTGIQNGVIADRHNWLYSVC